MNEAERDKLARATIEHALHTLIAERQAEVAAANDGLADAQVKLREWRRHGHLDRLVALRALSIAQIDDLADTDSPPGRHLEALQRYLAQHHPPSTAAPTVDENPAS